MKKLDLAVVGVTGMVGEMFMRILEERKVPYNNIYFFASARSAGTKITFNDKEYLVEELTEASFDRGIDIALFSAGSNTSLKFAPIAVSKGCIVVDNSSCWRMDDTVPLVVPEVNQQDIHLHQGIIANPNCSTIQAAMVLKPLHDRYKIKRVVFSTYQAVSGAGRQGWIDLEEGLKGEEPKQFFHPIANNVIPQIDSFLPNGYTKEEMKMVNETKKILHAPTIKVTATTVRIPVYNAHCEAVNIEFEKSFALDELVEVLRNAPGIVVQDDPENHVYPMPIWADGLDDVFVGRIRRDESVESGVNLWTSADNIRKGAATNAVQIAEELIKNWEKYK